MEATAKTTSAKGPDQRPPQGAAPKPQPQPAQLTHLQQVLARARGGDTSVLPEVERFLDENPWVWQDFYKLARLTEQAWLNKIAGKHLILSRSLRRQVEQFKRDLAGPTPTPLEKVLVERIAAAWLAVNCVEMAEGLGDNNSGHLARMRLRHSESANKRYLAAIKALAVTRRMSSGLKVEIHHTQAPDASEGGASTPGAARDRLNGMFKEALIEEERLASVDT